MDLRRYAHLVALAEEGNFGRAAQRVHLSQPAFSRSIQAAEQELGMALFKRGGRKVACTPAGSFVVERIRAVLHASNNLDRDLAMFRDGLSGDVRLGMGPSSSGHLLPPLLASLRSRYPSLRVHVRVQGQPELLALLRAQELDFAVMDARYVAGEADLRVEPLVRLKAGLFVRAGHPLLKHKTVRVADLAAYGFASGVLPPAVRRALLRLMGLGEADPLPFAVECNDQWALKGVTLATDAVMIGLPDGLEQEIAAGELRRLAVADLPEEVAEGHAAILSLHGRPFSPVSIRTIEALRAVVVRRPAKRATSASRKRTAAR